MAIPLVQFARSHSHRERIWIAEREDKIVGCVAIVKFSENIAQLRRRLLHPEVRGQGLGRKLLQDALHLGQVSD
ncbi:MAG: GNAT family N-acetyltransferase [Methanothrix sp.]|nr:GNAT family N-acetyltransferase [Methanothrix sp.]MDD4447508.1 GNAT family N-acetyltransferase [Methanothrix sp.]